MLGPCQCAPSLPKVASVGGFSKPKEGKKGKGGGKDGSTELKEEERKREQTNRGRRTTLFLSATCKQNFQIQEGIQQGFIMQGPSLRASRLYARSLDSNDMLTMAILGFPIGASHGLLLHAGGISFSP